MDVVVVPPQQRTRLIGVVEVVAAGVAAAFDHQRLDRPHLDFRPQLPFASACEMPTAFEVSFVDQEVLKKVKTSK